jgi:glucose/mannose-6-phosphate isomerase
VKELIAGFPQHIVQALEAAETAPFRHPARRFDEVLITGLGGSGIGGSMAAEWLAGIAKLPILVNKDYALPAFADRNTLVIASSYSGNTEETVMAAREALQRGCEVAVITGGGTLLELAREHQLNALTMPGGNPPRSMLGYSLTNLLIMLHRCGLEMPDPRPLLKEAAHFLADEQPAIRTHASTLAVGLAHSTCAVYAPVGYAAVAERVRQQLNENSKMLAWNAPIPEMNHNELVGWAAGNNNFAALFLRGSAEHPRNALRAEINKQQILTKTPRVFEITAQGANHLAEMLYLVHLTDWLSWELSEIHGADIMDIAVIDFLKNSLARS